MPIIKINNYYNFSSRESPGRLAIRKQEKYVAETKSIDSTDSNYSDAINYIVSGPPLKQLELLFKKLEIQFCLCLVGILVTISFYSALWFTSPCCQLPFRENSCAARSVLPPTNHSTLAEEVDEFVSLFWKISKFFNCITFFLEIKKFPHLTKHNTLKFLIENKFRKILKNIVLRTTVKF